MVFHRFLMVLLLASHALSANAEELVTLNTRPNVEQRFILIKPEKPVASVILFVGGKGALNLSSTLFGSPNIGWGKGNFLVRTRETFAKHGLLVAVVDAPSDKQSNRGMLGGFRASMDHVGDIDQVITYLKKQLDAPVWLVGTSRGTESAAFIAINSKQQPAGLVLTSSMTVAKLANVSGMSVDSMPLDQIAMPTLVVAHTQDACDRTPPSDAKRIGAMLTKSKKVEVKLFDGGDWPRSDRCEAMSYHGYLGIEDEVVLYISDFIKAN